MAMQVIKTTLTTASTANVVFAKPTGSYGKTPGLEIDDGSGAVAVIFRGADTDNGDGTMTAHVELTSAVSGILSLEIWDAP